MMLDGKRVLGRRLRGNLLEDPPGAGAAEVVRAVVATRSWPAEAAARALALRQATAPDLDTALADGEVVEAYAFRGGAYLMAPEAARTLLTVRGTTRVWESERYQRQGGFAVASWEDVRLAIRAALADGPLTRGEISARLAGDPRVRDLAPAALGAGADTLIKPLHWWGDVRFGPRPGGEATMRLWSPDPLPLPTEEEVDDAGRRAVELYLRAYGPATPASLRYWLTEGLSAPRRRVAGWVADLGDALTEVVLDGEGALALTADLPALAEAEPSDAVHLLPAYDPWVMNPGTSDELVVPAAARPLASRGARLAIRGGVVAGTWGVVDGEERVDWF